MALQDGPEGVATFIAEHGRRKRYNPGVSQDRWGYAKTNTTDEELHVY